MTSTVGTAAILFSSQALLYAVITVNMISVAQKDYAWTALSDFSVCTINYFMIKRISAAPDNWRLWLSYSLGGVSGSMVGIYFAP